MLASKKERIPGISQTLRAGWRATQLLVLALASVPMQPSALAAGPNKATCAGDADDNGVVNFGDLTAVLSNWLVEYSPSTGPGDANGDGVVNFLDVTTVLSHFGNSCENTVQLVVLGDSLSDVGRHRDLFREPRHPYWNGRYSNGPVWVEYLADFAGIASSGVKNYAVGGAASGGENCCTAGAPGLLTELEDLESDLTSGEVRIDSQTLFVVWIGANDFEIWRESGEFETTGPEILIADATDNVAIVVEALADLGATRVLVANLPDLGRVPRLTSSGDPDLSDLASTGTAIFNAHLAWSMSQIEAERGMDVILLDTYSIMNEVLDDPTAFGFVDAFSPCFDSTSGAECSEPGAYVFWDDLHPTTAAHEVLAGFAVGALARGGATLPDPNCDAPGDLVEILTPHAQFTLEDTLEIAGLVEAFAPANAELWVNGALTPVGGDGFWTTSIEIDPGRAEQPIVAELRTGNHVLDRDRIVAFYGDSVALGETVQDSIIASLRSSAIPPIRDEMTFELASGNVIGNALAQSIPDPLASDYSGTFQFEARPTFVGYSCHTADVELHDGFIRFRFSMHDVRVNYHIHAWLSGVPDPGFDCDGTIYAGAFPAYLDAMIMPSTTGAAGEVRVVPISEFEFDIVNFFHDVFNCDFDDLTPGLDIDAFAEQQAGNIESMVRETIRSHVTAEGLAGDLEKIIAGVSLSRTIGDAIGVEISGDVASIDVSPSDALVSFDTRIGVWGGAATPRTLAPTAGEIQHSGYAPDNGQPHDFALSVAKSTLNQLLLARTDLLLQSTEIREVDLGTGPRPITSGLLSAIAPSLRLEDQDTPYTIRVKPTLPPMLADDGSSESGELDLYLGQVLVEFINETGASAPDLAMTLDVHGQASLGFDAATGSLTVAISIPEKGISAPTIVTNRVCADERVVRRLVQLIGRSFSAGLDGEQVKLALPSLYGLDINVVGVDERSGYVTVYVEVGTEHGRPDLTITVIDLPDAIDVNFPFRIRFKLANIGRAPVFTPFDVGASISSDPLLLNGDDDELVQYTFNFGGNPLQPGESRWLSLENVHLPGALLQEQTVFLVADVPASPGSNGPLCESSEINNLASTTVLTTVPDASIVSVVPPDDVVGGIGPRPYRVTVRRNNVGIDNMQIPVKVTIGDPALTWGDVLVQVPRGGEATVNVMVPSPASVGAAGQSNTFPVLACANLASDSNRLNDCASSSVSIAVPYWDLRFAIEAAPRSARQCTSIDWRVRVTNHGNAPSMNVCAITGVGRYSGERNWNGNVGLVHFTTPSLNAGQSWTFNVKNYFLSLNNVPCQFLALGTQYIKAEINYSGGCYDNHEQGNYAQKSIRIDLQ